MSSQASRKKECDEDVDAHVGLRKGHVFRAVNLYGGYNILGDQYISQSSPYKRLLESLTCRETNARFNDIADPHDTSFEWAFKKSYDEQDEYLHRYNRPCGFADWLLDDQTVFWVSGKSGSGKSTFTKYLATHSETRRLLKESTAEKWCIIATHYFWMSGSALQYNMKGCLANLCWQLIRIQKARADQLLETILGLAPSSELSGSLHQRFAALPSKRYLEDWSARELESFLQYLVDVPTTKVCIFLDGLDEYNRNVNLGEIMSLITRITRKSKVKVCVSSRPELSLESSLAKHPHMQIHDFTRTDVIALAKSRLSAVVAESNLCQLTDTNIACLAEEIATAAEGVFIWALLAVEHMAEAMYVTDDLSTLRKGFLTMPEALHDCYNTAIRHARNKSGPVDAWVQTLFTVSIELWTPLNVICLSIGALQISNDHNKMASYILAQWLRDSEYLRRQIHTQSAGLLRLQGWPNSTRLEELITRYRNAKLVRMLELLLPDFAVQTVSVHLEVTEVELRTVTDLLMYLSDDKGLCRCLVAEFQPIHRTVHRFFVDQTCTVLSQDQMYGFSQLLGQSLILPILITSAVLHVGPHGRLGERSAVAIEAYDLALRALEVLSKCGAEIPLVPVLDVVARFVHSYQSRSTVMGARAELRTFDSKTRFRSVMDIAGFIHSMNLNLMTHSNFLTGYKASSYYKGYLLNCCLGGCRASSEISYSQKSTEILSMLNNGADVLTPQVLTSDHMLEILSPLSRCFIFVLECLLHRKAAAEHLKALLHELHARLPDDPNEGSSKHQNNNSFFSNSTIESDIEVFFRTQSSKPTMHMSVSNLYRFVTDLFQARCTKDHRHLLPFPDYGKFSRNPYNSEKVRCRTDTEKAIAAENVIRRYLVVGQSQIGRYSLIHSIKSGDYSPDYRIPWRAPDMTFEPQDKDWYFNGSLKEWHGARERGEITLLDDFKKSEKKAGLTPDYET